jgi:hypothetical protein
MNDWRRRLLAAVIATTLVAAVVCDLAIPGFRDWWDRHALSGSIVSSLLVLGVTALIVDEILARRQRRERATSVGVQSLIVFTQAVRAYKALQSNSGDDVAEEMRSLAGMLLTASTILFDDPQARVFLENVQRLAGTMFRATSSARSSELQPQLEAAMSAVQTSRLPLLARLPAEYRSTVEEES